MEPAGKTVHSVLFSASISGYVAITGSGSARSLGKNDGAVINPVDTPDVVAMTDSSAVAIRIDGTTIYARRAGSTTDHYNATPASANLSETSLLMVFSAAGELPARVDMFGLAMFSSWLQPDDRDRCIAFMNQRMAP